MSTTLTHPRRGVHGSGLVPSPVMALAYEQAAQEHLGGLRDLTRRLLLDRGMDRETTDGVIVVVSELYTNVITHVGLGPCTVLLSVYRPVIRLEVRDAGDAVPAIPQNPGQYLQSVEGENGRGLSLVSLYADRFRFERMDRRRGTGKAAIAEWDGA